MALLGISLELVGCSSDTWKTGWMCNRSRARPSWKAWDDTFSMIGKGPRKQWSSLFEGQVILMLCESNQTASPTLNGGIGCCDTEWALYCLRAQETWLWRYRCNSLIS